MWDIPDKVANSGASVAGKHLHSEFNNRQHEVEKVVTSTGMALTAYPIDPNSTADPNETMLAEAISRLVSLGIAGTDSGVANAYVLSAIGNTVVPKALFDGMIVVTEAVATNTAASTANVFGLGIKALRTYADAALSGGEVVLGRPTAWRYKAAANGGAGAWLILPWAAAPAVSEPGEPGSEPWALLPIYPEITNAGNVATITSAAGQVVLAAGQTILWRGWQTWSSDSLTLAQRTFATAASKTYHLRLNRLTGVLALRDLADATYNPGGLAETNAAFDTSYDDALLARVVTNASNVATVTPLKNKPTLSYSATHATGDFSTTTTEPANYTYMAVMNGTLNWARAPMVQSFNGEVAHVGTASVQGGARIQWVTGTRYGFSWAIYNDWAAAVSGLYATGNTSLMAA